MLRRYIGIIVFAQDNNGILAQVVLHQIHERKGLLTQVKSVMLCNELRKMLIRCYKTGDGILRVAGIELECFGKGLRREVGDVGRKVHGFDFFAAF